MSRLKSKGILVSDGSPNNGGGPDKYKGIKLILGIIFDAIGYVSFVIPGIGEFADVIWAPIAGFLITRMYKGNAGKVAGVIAFVEELLPGFDIIPTFTLMWIYTYVVKGKK